MSGELHRPGGTLCFFLPEAWAAPPVITRLLYTMGQAGIGVEEGWFGVRICLLKTKQTEQFLEVQNHSRPCRGRSKSVYQYTCSRQRPLWMTGGLNLHPTSFSEAREVSFPRPLPQAASVRSALAHSLPRRHPSRVSAPGCFHLALPLRLGESCLQTRPPADQTSHLRSSQSSGSRAGTPSRTSHPVAACATATFAPSINDHLCRGEGGQAQKGLTRS